VLRLFFGFYFLKKKKNKKFLTLSFLYIFCNIICVREKLRLSYQ